MIRALLCHSNCQTPGSLAILFIILNSYYEWVNVATGSWIAAFVLGAIGLQLLFNKDKKD